MRVNLAVAAASAAILAATGALAEPQWKHIGTLGQRHFVLVDGAAANDPAVLKQAATSVCTASGPCIVAFWSDAALVPTTMPMNKAQQESVVAQFVRNPGTGKEEVMLKCAPGSPPGTKCLR